MPKKKGVCAAPGEKMSHPEGKVITPDVCESAWLSAGADWNFSVHKSSGTHVMCVSPNGVKYLNYIQADVVTVGGPNGATARFASSANPPSF